MTMKFGGFVNVHWQLRSIPMIPVFGDPKWVPGKIPHNLDETRRTDKGRNPRILVIDDEALIAETVVEILNEEGFEATYVSNGLAAIEAAQTIQPDIVLSDVIMPGLNGIETGIRIREMIPNCRIILFSGQAATVDLLENARQRGHRFDILAKPIKPEQLISVIRGGARSQ
jgi:CheY-like chemotaxis protein